MKTIINKKSRNAFLHISLIKGVGAQTMRYLLSLFEDKNLFENIYAWNKSDWINCGFSESKAITIVAGLADQKLLEKELDLIEKHNARFILVGDDDFPSLMIESSVLPILLYIKDKKDSLWHKSSCFLAGVASRKATDYTFRAAQTFFKDVAKDNVCIVSGGAIGGDTFIHRSALDLKLPTVAVLGSGFANLYPKNNFQLFEKIIDAGGALISPFSISTMPSPGTFPARNHIIAGMSNATLVFQAAQKSGTLITAYSALEQSRDVGAVPGLFDDMFSAGCHSLITQGAMLIQNGSDVRVLLKMPENKERVEQGNEKVEEVLVFQNEPVDQILLLCKTPLTTHEIADKLSENLQNIQKRLFAYLVAGKVEQDMLGRWVIV